MSSSRRTLYPEPVVTVKDRVKATAQPRSASLAWGHVLGCGAFLTLVIFWPPWPEPFSLPKVYLASVTALVGLPLLWVRRSRLHANRWPLFLAAGLLVAGVASLALSGAPVAVSLWGDWGRRSGLVFLVVLVLIFAFATCLTRPEIRVVVAWLMWAGVPATAYGLLQLVGMDPFPWADRGWIVSTFGNPNFAGAGLAILALLTAGTALTDTFSTPWRMLMAPLAALEALVALSTGSSLAVFSLGAGVLLGVLTWAFKSAGSYRGLVTLGLVLLGLLGAASTVLGLFGIGPLVAAVSPDTLVFRRWYWGAGVQMALGHPLVGVGPDGFGRFYGEFRSFDAAQNLTGTNAAHDVPLQWAATLGIPAGLLYLALVATVAAVVLRRLWTAGPKAAALALPLLAAWGAYQVQSLVSIDEIGVSVLGWLLMGALLATTSEPSSDSSPPTPRVLWVTAGALGLVGALVWLPVVSASASSRTVVQGTSVADVEDALRLLQDGRLPCSGAIPVAQWLTTVAPSEASVNAVYAYVERDDRCYTLVTAAADFAIQLGEASRAVSLAEQAVDIDPLSYSPWLLLARAQALAGDTSAAQGAINEAAVIAPGNGDVAQVAADLSLVVPVPPPA